MLNLIKACQRDYSFFLINLRCRAGNTCY